MATQNPSPLTVAYCFDEMRGAAMDAPMSVAPVMKIPLRAYNQPQ